MLANRRHKNSRPWRVTETRGNSDHGLVISHGDRRLSAPQCLTDRFLWICLNLPVSSRGQSSLCSQGDPQPRALDRPSAEAGPPGKGGPRRVMTVVAAVLSRMCGSLGSPVRQNLKTETEVCYKELAHTVMGPRSPKSAFGELETQETWWCSSSTPIRSEGQRPMSQSGRGANSPTSPFCPSRAFSGWMTPPYTGESDLLRSDHQFGY